MLAAPFCVSAQQKSHITSEQVTHAIEELEKLAQEQIQKNAVPGLAIAVVFQDKVVYAKGFGVRDVNSKGASRRGHSVSAGIAFETDWLDGRCRVSRRRQNHLGLQT